MLQKCARRGFFNKVFGKQEPISYKTTKVLPLNQQLLFNVVVDVNEYDQFIPWINESKVHPDTRVENFENGVRMGRFDAETKIGFSSLSFAYMSRVTFEEPYSVLSLAEDSRIFQGLYSHWKIEPLEEDLCEVEYNIRMTFSNPLYTHVTKSFFDYLATNINKAFEQRCLEKYYKDRPISVKTPKKI